MKTFFILIVLSSYGHVSAHEFNTRAACENAVKRISNASPVFGKDITAFCIEDLK